MTDQRAGDAVTGPSMSEPRLTTYREAHSALNRPLLGYYLFEPAAAQTACLILGVALRQPWFFVIMAGLLVPVMIWITLVYRNWPTGIQIDASAISIGAIGSARAARRGPTVNHQSRGLFTCTGPSGSWKTLWPHMKHYD